MDDFWQIVEPMVNSEEEVVLATIINVKGSSYKKEGSCMLFFKNGSQIGLLSAGCLEHDLAHHAQQVLRTGGPMVLSYDNSDEDDGLWGNGAGCFGVITILLEKIGASQKADYLKVKEFLEKGVRVLSNKTWSGKVECRFTPENGEAWGSGMVPDFKDFKKSMHGGEKWYHDHSIKDEVYQHLYIPKPRLFVMGAGHDAVPIVSLAIRIGFSVIICDWREALCQKDFFPDGVRLEVGSPAEIYQKENFTNNDFVVVMNHNFQRDLQMLTLLKNEELRYLGVLGPKERTQRLLCCIETQTRISSPAGLSIGARGPEEIAVSIIAQMLEIMNKPVHTVPLCLVPD
ncbi:MAG: XdhC family protein [Bacillota bacterium]|nr:XdhC family protein [Bacillota bacterium]